jgi:hypothetical protein
MFGSDMISIIIMMIFLYLLLSMICSVLSEMVAGALAWRASTTYKGFRDFFNDRKGAALIDPLYKHPLIDGLRRPKWWDSVARLGATGAGKPNEIPMVNFVHALRDTVQSHPPLDSDTKEVVDTVLKEDKETVRDWWEGAEATMHNRYKAKMQWLVAIIALLATVVSNFDSIMVFNALWTEAPLKAGVQAAMAAAVKAGESDIAGAIDNARRELENVPLLSWSTKPGDRRSVPEGLVDWASKILGLLITTIVVARTTPFAFDFFRYGVQILGRRAGAPQLH